MNDKESDLMRRIEFYKKQITDKQKEIQKLVDKISTINSSISQCESLMINFESRLLELHNGEAK